MPKNETTRNLLTPAQPDLYEKSYEEQLASRKAEHVECLGQTFPSDDARREHYLELLAEKLKDPEFRKQPGFPIGEDEDILRLSDPPYYTACPNPFLEDFIAHVGTAYDPETDDYENTPFAIDVSEGKTDALYKAHGYHTKVPHKAIMPAILHYTKPGDLVLDGFCGSGMTGVAAQMCEAPDKDTKAKIEKSFRDNALPQPKWGARRVILNDLSPAATLITANYNIPFNVQAFEREAKSILAELKEKIGWMYETRHTNGTAAMIDYTVWSEVYSCSHCGGEVVFLECAMDEQSKRVLDVFECPQCNSQLTKAALERRFETIFDHAINKPIKVQKRKPVLIIYSIGNSKFEKAVDNEDLRLLRKIGEYQGVDNIPHNAFPFDDMWEAPRLLQRNITNIHHMFLPRASIALSTIWGEVRQSNNRRNANMLWYFVEQAIAGMSVLNRYSPTHFSQVNRQMSGVYYVGSQHSEVSPWYILEGKLSRLVKVFKSYQPPCGGASVSVGTTACLPISEKSIDYVFTDPPFGDNFAYSELNYLVESWHRIITDPKPEAVVERSKKNAETQKKLPDYQSLMRSCFVEYNRVLKPGRWMTVVFHNSKNSVWNAIQEALISAGFVVADVRTLDKKQQTLKQLSSTAVKQDLVISVYKPNDRFEKKFEIKAGTEEGVWEFLNAHLAQLPVFVSSVPGQVDVIAERLDHRLFDRMVAFHLQRNVSVPLSVAEFLGGLAGRYTERDGMYFLTDQVVEYDKKRAKAEGVRHFEMFPDNEANTIQWLRQELGQRPRIYAEIQPDFMKMSVGWAKNEKPIELSMVLDENFLRYNGDGDVPNQVHAYLSSNFRDMRNREKSDRELRSKGKDRWYVPDPNKLQDLEAKREKQLLKEFDEYLASREKRIKQPRHEVIRAGFKRSWGNRDYESIKAIAGKIPEAVIQEDQQLLMWYDMAMTRIGDDVF